MNELPFLRLAEDPLQGPESEAPAGTLRSLVLHAPLRAHVAHILACREHLADGRHVVERVLGLSPRTFNRLARLHGMLRTLRSQPRVAWADLAAGSGYYDQAHLTNEFRALCGLTPGEFARRAVSVSSNTVG